MRIFSCRNETGWFVDDNMQRPIGVDELPVDFHVIVRGRLRTKIGATPTINCNTPVGDQLVTMSARTDAGSCEEAIEAHI